MKNKKLIWIALILIGGIIIMANYQTIFRSIIPPDPEIVSSQADGSSSTLFEYSIRVKGAVINKGGDGSVIVEATLTQGENTWTKTTDLYMTSYETKDFEIIFDEAELLNNDPQYSIRTYPLGAN